MSQRGASKGVGWASRRREERRRRTFDGRSEVYDAQKSRVSSAYAYGFIVVYAITCASRFTRWLAVLDGIM